MVIESDANLKISNSGYLNYNYYYYEYNYVSYRIRWSFNSSNIYVGITVRIMDHDEYEKYRDGGLYIYYLVSDGSYRKDYGTFEVPYADYWYILFMNLDFDQQQTYLTYEVSVNNINPYLVIFIIFITLIGIGIIIGIALSIRKKQRVIKEPREKIFPPLRLSLKLFSRVQI